MRIVNIMNFIRQCDPRKAGSVELLYDTTREQVALVKEFGVKNTFLLQYDALIDPRYQELFLRERDEKMELGLWVEIVKPLCDKAGIPWRGREDWTWDWHIVPGFLMAYTQEERKRLMAIAMNDFRAIYGHYPKTVASWLLDSYTAAYLADSYPVETLAICRDQVETDAYTLVGGYFNQGYYPCRRNIFTPAQTAAEQVNIPVFRLLGPDPIHNYDSDRYITDPRYLPGHNVYTLEPAWRCGSDPEIVRWFFKGYFEDTCIGFTYAQLGQENSFGPKLLPGLRMQLELLKEYPQVTIQTMAETGAWFKQQYSETPATCNVALTDWTSSDLQSIYYNCKHYCANLFRQGSVIFLRSLYLFDEKVAEHYLDTPCTTWDASYENLPVVDAMLWKGSSGLTLDISGSAISVAQEGQALIAQWGDKQVRFDEEGIHLHGIPAADFSRTGSCAIHQEGEQLHYEYNGNRYHMVIANAHLLRKKNGWVFAANDDRIDLAFDR